MTKKEIAIGDVLREHREDGYTDLGRVVWKNVRSDLLWWIPFPTAGESKKKNYFVKAPIAWCLSKTTQSIESGELPRLSAIEFAIPDSWSLSDEELRKQRSSHNLTRPSRRVLFKWLNKRNENHDIIAPIVANNDSYVLVEQDQAPALAALRAAELERSGEFGSPSQPRVLRLLRLYLLGAGHRNCLLPAWANSGCPGSSKFCKSKTGRPNIHTTPEDKTFAGYVCQKIDRKNLSDGYTKYKNKQRYPVKQAYTLTMEEYYPSTVKWVSATEKVVELLPKKDRPTYAEFRAHGPGKAPENAAQRLNLGVNYHERNGRGLTGTARDGILAVGQNSWIDSTSEDQTPVSSASRLKILPSTWRTMVMEGYTAYILGIHSGFEHPSVLTGLMAMLHGGEPKQKWCKRHGVDIQEGEWHCFMPKRVRGDNGDLKGERGIVTLERAQITLEIVRSYGAELKGPIESGHKQIHRSGEHHNAGSTQGKRRQRGEPKREKQACRTHAENMPHLIRSILHHNNIDRVPELLTMEMRRDGVEPTRRAVFEWCIANGYMVSEPIQLDDLRAQCLPRFGAVIKGNGIHVFDPRDPERRLIPHMVYWSQWLHKSGLTEKARRKVIETEIHMDPSYPAEAWVYLEGSRRLDLRSADPLRAEVTLCDWLQITDDDKLKAFLDANDMESAEASRLSSNAAQNAQSAKAKKQEVDDLNERAAKPEGNKRENLKQEQEYQRRMTLGIEDLAVKPVKVEVDADLAIPHDLSDEELQDMLMAQVRPRRTA